MIRNVTSLLFLASLLLLPVLQSCSSLNQDNGAHNGDISNGEPGKGDYYGDPSAQPPEPLNTAAGDLVIYELQARSANACRLDTEYADSCAVLPRPAFHYHGDGCEELADLRAIRKSTMDDLLKTHAEPHRTKGITLQYIDEIVGADTVWLMPFFPHNFHYDLPHPCDDIGSPYAVRDYYHVRGTLSESCVLAAADEWSESPCWGDDSLVSMIQAAHARRIKVMIDVAFNHLGHEYLYYDYADATPVREYLESGVDLWDFEATLDAALVWPKILDRAMHLPEEAGQVLAQLCPEGVSTGQEAVRRYLMWREGFDYERASMSCERPATLENQLPGFYLSSDGNSPSRGVGDNFTNNWVDVKFLFHNESNLAHYWEFVRSREMAFRVLNYYLSLGVDAFRLDHANGLTENEWRYIFRKARHYQQLRGMDEPIFLAESFHNILELNRVFDVLTEGYHHDICHGTRDASYIEKQLFVNRTNYLKDLSYVLLNLENHDEGRLLHPSTGFDIDRGATFYAIAATSRGTLMLQIGQEWGEPWDLGFRKSDYLRGRFPQEANWDPRGDDLTDIYRAIHHARRSSANRALRHGEYYFPRTDTGLSKDQLFAVVKYMPDCSNTVFAFHRLWVDEVEATYIVDDELAERICLREEFTYRLIDALTGEDVGFEHHPEGRTGAHLKQFGVHVRLDEDTSFRWLRIEREHQGR